jgi:hypothetical protein
MAGGRVLHVPRHEPGQADAGAARRLHLLSPAMAAAAALAGRLADVRDFQPKS